MIAAALAGSASAARDATANEYGLPYPVPVTSALAFFCTSACSMNGDQMSHASTCPELKRGQARRPAGGSQRHVVHAQARLVQHGEQVVVGRAALGHRDPLALQLRDRRDRRVLRHQQRGPAVGWPGRRRRSRSCSPPAAANTGGALPTPPMSTAPAPMACSIGGPEVKSDQVDLERQLADQPGRGQQGLRPVPAWSPTCRVTWTRWPGSGCSSPDELAVAAAARGRQMTQDDEHAVSTARRAAAASGEYPVRSVHHVSFRS